MDAPQEKSWVRDTAAMERSTVGPPNKGHIGFCREVVFSSKVIVLDSEYLV